MAEQSGEAAVMRSDPAAAAAAEGWTLSVQIDHDGFVADNGVSPLILGVEHVRGDTHIGGVFLKVISHERLRTRNSLSDQKDSDNWSDYAFWWQEKKQWLLSTNKTLDQYMISSESSVVLTKMHKNLLVRLPDLQVFNVQVDYSAPVFRVVKHLCRRFSIAYFEELSLQRQLDKDDVRRLIQQQREENYSQTMRRVRHLNVDHAVASGTSTMQNRISTGPPKSPGYETIRSGTSLSPSKGIRGYSNHSASVNEYDGGDMSLIHSPDKSVRDVFSYLKEYKDFDDRALMQACWLDSSRSLLEQDINENMCLSLKFKYFTFFDLYFDKNLVRLNQLYEQARWSTLTGEVSSTDEELVMFAAFLLRISETNVDDGDEEGNDGVDHAIGDLEISLGRYQQPQEKLRSSLVQNIPEIFSDAVKICESNFGGIFKQWNGVTTRLKNTTLSIASGNEKTRIVEVKGCEVKPKVHLTRKKFTIVLFVPQPDGMVEIKLRFLKKDDYARWLAAFKCASRGKTMADASFAREEEEIKQFLNLQDGLSKRAVPQNGVAANGGKKSAEKKIDLAELFAPSFLKQIRSKQALNEKLLKSYQNIKHMSNAKAKLSFIKAWQELPDCGISYFFVTFDGKKRRELIGVSFNKITQIDTSNGNILNSWRFVEMREWKINWQRKQIILNFAQGGIKFTPTSADCQVIHELIGGYIFLSMRSFDRPMPSEEHFYKLTSGNRE